VKSDPAARRCTSIALTTACNNTTKNLTEPSKTSRLPAPSQRKALDWSLVLASQGIPHLIAPPDAAGKWSLQLAPEDVSRAAAAIRQFEIENRPRPWQQTYLEGRVTFDWVATVWAMFLVCIHVLREDRPTIKDVGVMHGTDALKGEWWRLVTATQLHADWGHLASNLSIGVVLLGLVMGRWGTALGMLLALLAGAGGNIANLLVRPEVFSLGASTVVMGCLGLLALLPSGHGSAHARWWRGILSSLGAAVLLFLLLGLDPNSDVLGHFGGFASGVIIATAMRWATVEPGSRWCERVAVLILGLLLFIPWWQAMNH